jgi:adenylate cyclase
VFKATGDGLLVEFSSVVSAVSCAAEIQRDLQLHNESVPDDRAIQLRIGINLGDIIVEGDDMFGDGVNIAARIESISPPGGVAVSQTVRDHLGTRLDLHFEDMGEQKLKNIDRPIRVYLLGSGARSGLSYPTLPDKPSIAVLWHCRGSCIGSSQGLLRWTGQPVLGSHPPRWLDTGAAHS